jgi:aspartyl protease family protein
VVNGGAPKSVAPGETHQGVKVISTTSDQAVIEQSGKRHTLAGGRCAGELWRQHGLPGRGSRIVHHCGGGGHFMTTGQINGKAVQFMVDTGATALP